MEIRNLVEERKPKTYKIADCDAKLLIVEPKPKELTELRKQCTYKNRGSRSLGSNLNEKRFNEALMDKFIVGWEAIKLDGKDLECNLKNKIICDDNWTQFSECWNNVIGGFEEAEEEEAEAEVKN